jgi:hypothetical protein
VNIQEYISSGIVASYVLGVATDSEREEFEKLAKTYPELITIRNAFELSLEKQAFANQLTPPSFIKDKIRSNINCNYDNGFK